MSITKSKNLIKKRIEELYKEIEGYEYVLETLHELELEDDLEEQKKHGDLK